MRRRDFTFPILIFAGATPSSRDPRRLADIGELDIWMSRMTKRLMPSGGEICHISMSSTNMTPKPERIDALFDRAAAP